MPAIASIREGVEKDDIVEQVLSETSPPPRSMDAELALLGGRSLLRYHGQSPPRLRQLHPQWRNRRLRPRVLEREANSIAGILQLFDPVRVDFHPEPAGKGAG